MKRLLLVLTLALSTGVLALARDDGAPPAEKAWDGQSLAVHEWGTFTTLQGSDGVVLDGLAHEERDLPEFVYDLRDHTGMCAFSPKMETPVIYFYSPQKRRVRVDVSFPKGLVTQWYPGARDVNGMGYDAKRRRAQPTGKLIEDLEDGWIKWRRLTVLPPGEEPPLPPVAEDDPWRFSRQVDANTLRYCNWSESKRLGIRKWTKRAMLEHEKSLFYRGLGKFDLPLVGKVVSEEASHDWYSVKLDLTNTEKPPLRHLFLIWVKDGRSGFTRIDSLTGTQKVAASLELAPVKETNERLVHALANSLVKTGLYTKEAYAMARTWQEGYFQDEGLRVLYVLPESFVDRELPLKISGMGNDGDYELTRTFVGRTELLSPEREAAMERAVTAFATGDAAAGKELRSWGRFGVPYLNRVMARTQDPAIRRVVEQELERQRLRH